MKIRLLSKGRLNQTALAGGKLARKLARLPNQHATVGKHPVQIKHSMRSRSNSSSVMKSNNGQLKTKLVAGTRAPANKLLRVANHQSKQLVAKRLQGAKSSGLLVKKKLALVEVETTARPVYQLLELETTERPTLALVESKPEVVLAESEQAEEQSNELVTAVSSPGGEAKVSEIDEKSSSSSSSETISETKSDGEKVEKIETMSKVEKKEEEEEVKIINNDEDE